jgi:hypothetical protein
MNELLMPQAFAGLCIERDEAVRVQVLADPVPPPEIECSGAGGTENDAAFFV